MARTLINRSFLCIARAASALALAACALPALAAVPATERQALIDLYNSTHGAAWTNHTNWLGAVGTECTWYGVDCNPDHTHIANIDLSENRLGGSLPDSLNQLKALQRFNANLNQLTGSIPSLRGLTALVTFYANRNQLTGNIPALRGLTALQEFSVGNNQLTGGIPALSGLTALRVFEASTNRLTGSIPSLSGLTALQAFWVDHNQLTGSIPPLNGLTALQSFRVSDNQLTGRIPSVSGLTKLEYIQASGNQITSNIPTTERQILVDLYNSTNGAAWTNHANWLGAVGTECSWFGVACDPGQTHVVQIYLTRNNLVGHLPASLNQLTALQRFSFSGNQLTGSIPAAERQVLIDLYKSTHGTAWTAWTRHDGWMGAIGTECTWQGVGCNPDQTHVAYIDLRENHLVGSLPASLNQLTALRYFSVDENYLTGSIPSLDGLTALQHFSVHTNQLTGSIPTLSGLTALQYFNAGSNFLTGNIPSLSGLKALQSFSVYKNVLTGSIPSLDGLTALKSFYVAYNQLTGTPPAAPASLKDEASRLCPNYLSTPSPTDAAWDKATRSIDSIGHTWSYDCSAAPTYTASTNAGAGGSISPANQSGKPGATPSFTIAPDTGMVVDQVSTTCGKSRERQPALVTSGPLTHFTTAPLIDNCTVNVSFKASVGSPQ